MALYADDLLTTVKRDAFLATAQGNFTDAQLLAIADNCMRMYYMPMLMSLREGFYRVPTDIAFVANQQDYQLPQYAMYGKLESVQYLDNNKQLLPGQLTRIEVENLQDVLPTLNGGVPRYFMLNSSYISVFPYPTTTQDYIRAYYDRRPGLLIKTSQAAQVLSVNPSTGIVTYTSAPPAGYTSSSKQDFYHGQSPYQLLVQSTATAQSGSTQTFPAADAALLTAGDWVCPLDQSVFIAMPEELMPFLADMVIKSLSRTQQDGNLYKAQMQMIADEARQLLSSTGNRLPGNPKRIRMNNPLVRNRSIPRYR